MKKEENAKGKTAPRTTKGKAPIEKQTPPTEATEQPKIIELAMMPEQYDAIVNYLASQPWGDVNHLLNIIGQSTKRPQ